MLFADEVKQSFKAWLGRVGMELTANMHTYMLYRNMFYYEM